MAREYTIPDKARPIVDRLPQFRCTACGTAQCSVPASSSVKCLYCGRQHRLQAGKWVRS